MPAAAACCVLLEQLDVASGSWHLAALSSCSGAKDDGACCGDLGLLLLVLCDASAAAGAVAGGEGILEGRLLAGPLLGLRGELFLELPVCLDLAFCCC